MYKKRQEVGEAFIEIVQLQETTGSEKIVGAIAVMTQVLLDCRDILEGLDRRMYVPPKTKKK